MMNRRATRRPAIRRWQQARLERIDPRRLPMRRGRNQRSDGGSSIRTLLAAVFAGAALAYILDPERGRRRRALVRDKMASLTHRGARRSRKLVRMVRSQSYGYRQRALHRLVPHELPPQDDVTLAHRVESQVFRGHHLEKGALNISAEKGIVVLRGQLEDPEQIRSIEREALRVPGVHKVESFLHLAGTAAPNKAAARTAPGMSNGVVEAESS